MMSDNLDSLGGRNRTMTVMKMKALRFPGIEEFKRAAQLPIVISRDHDRLTKLPELFEEVASFRPRGSIVNEVAENDQMARPIFVH
ncbi:MAG: hypothetical protein QOE34_292 [Verrucomicrobiota bacterium]